jgi:hypothetical protein
MMCPIAAAQSAEAIISHKNALKDLIQLAQKIMSEKSPLGGML